MGNNVNKVLRELSDSNRGKNEITKRFRVVILDNNNGNVLVNQVLTKNQKKLLSAEILRIVGDHKTDDIYT